MNESKRVIVRVAGFVCFVLGFILFLFETRSSGEAPQTFRLAVTSNPLAIVSAAIAGLALMVLVVLFFWERKKYLEHF